MALPNIARADTTPNTGMKFSANAIYSNFGLLGSASRQKVNPGAPSNDNRPVGEDVSKTNRLLDDIAKYLTSINATLKAQIDFDKKVYRDKQQAEREAMIEQPDANPEDTATRVSASKAGFGALGLLAIGGLVTVAMLEPVLKAVDAIKEKMKEWKGDIDSIFGGLKDTFDGIKNWLTGDSNKPTTPPSTGTPPAPPANATPATPPPPAASAPPPAAQSAPPPTNTNPPSQAKTPDAERQQADQPGFTDPVDNYRITSGFGSRKRPKKGASRNHKGLDMAVPEGTPVKATAAGVVVTVKYDSKGGGNMIEIDHGGGLVTQYMHLSSFKVNRGDKVAQGQVIGGAGHTGTATGPHLHFGVKRNGKNVNPRPYITGAKNAAVQTASTPMSSTVPTAQNTEDKKKDGEDIITTAIQSVGSLLGSVIGPRTARILTTPGQDFSQKIDSASAQIKSDIDLGSKKDDLSTKAATEATNSIARTLSVTSPTGSISVIDPNYRGGDMINQYLAHYRLSA